MSTILTTHLLSLKTICRCCHTEGDFKSLKEPYKCRGQVEVYYMMLKETFGILITPPTKEESFTICNDCIKRLRDSTKFRNQVETCEEKFNQYYQLWQKTEVQNEEIVIEIKKENSFVENLKDEMVDIDIKNEFNEFENFNAIVTNVKTSLNNVDEVQDFDVKVNGIENTITNEVQSLDNDITTVENNMEIALEHLKKEKTAINNENLPGCVFSQKKCNSKDLLKITIKENINKSYKCNDCKQLFNNLSNLKKHSRTVHNKPKQFNKDIKTDAGSHTDSEYESDVPGPSTKKKVCMEVVHKKCITYSRQDLGPSETQSTDNELGRDSPLEIIGDIVIDNNQMEVDDENPTIDNLNKPRQIIGVSLKKVPKTSAERGREFRARKALLKQQSKQQQEPDAIVEIATEDVGSAGPSEIRTLEKKLKSAEATRRWREKKRGVSKPTKKHAKTAAQRMREYRERKKFNNSSGNNEEQSDLHDLTVTSTYDDITKHKKAHESFDQKFRKNPFDKTRLKNVKLSNNIVCRFCNKKVQEHKYERHLKIHVGKTECINCCAIFDSTDLLKEHSKLHKYENMYTCDVCKKHFIVKSTLKRHIDIHHMGKCRKFMCHVCGVCFNDVTNLRTHTINVHQKLRLYECPVCQKKLASKKTLKIHMRMHTGERPYVCDECGEGFTCFTTLRKHRKKHDVMKKYGTKYVCEICETTFQGRGQLTHHLRSEHPGSLKKSFSKYKTNYFPCPSCNRVFSQKFSLDRHIKKHGAIVKVPCDICNKMFIDKFSLARHMRNVHTTKEKVKKEKVQCNMCKRKVHDIENHMNVHTVRPMTCDTCGKNYPDAAFLHRHIMNVHHGVNKVFQCTKCDRRPYTRKENLRSHMMKKHGCDMKTDEQ